MKKLLRFIKYYNEPNEHMLRDRADSFARQYFRNKPLVSQELRALQVGKYKQAFRHSYRWEYAKKRLLEN